MESTHITNKQSNTSTSNQLNIRINKKLFVNILLTLLIAFAGLQTWQLVSLQAKIAEAKNIQIDLTSSPQTPSTSNSQVQTESQNSGVNSLPAQVGGC